MINEDISFVLPSEYIKYDNSYSIREYIYDFSFRTYINTVDTIKSIEIYKNGEKYDNVIVNNIGNNYYYVKDMDIIKKGNYHYGVKVILNDSKIYYNGFYLKVLSSQIENDIKINYFATQGTHENFNALNILLKVQSEYHIHSVKLYRKYINEDWIYLGEMLQGTYGYMHKDLLFDIKNICSSTLFYKAVVTTSNDLKKTMVISVPITLATFSLNNIQYLGNTHGKYSIYGGLVGTIISPNHEFNNEIFELIVDTSEKKYLRIKIKNKKYSFYAENFKVIYPQQFIYNQTNEEKNIFELSGKGVIRQIISEGKDIIKNDSCEFNATIECGSDYSVIFNIHPDTDNSLSVHTEETLNNIVRYNDLYTKSTQEYNDKTISNVRYNGILVFNNELNFLNVDTLIQQKLPIDQSRIDNLMRNSDFTTYNLSNFYFISFSEKGISFTVFDGINYDEYNYDFVIYDPTLQYIKNNICFRFDTKNKIVFEFINYDLTKNFEIIKIIDNQLTINNCNDSVSIIFNTLRSRLLNQLGQNYTFTENDETFVARFGKTYLLKQQIFESMNFDSFAQNMYMYEFNVVITTSAEVEGIKKDAELSIKATVNLNNAFFNIEKTDMNYMIGSYISNNESYNQKPLDVMELLNSSYYIKLSKSLKTKNKNDYGHYTVCELFNRNSKIYSLTFDDVLTSDFFTYKDVCKTRVVPINNDEIMILIFKDNKYIINHINLASVKRTKQYIINSRISCQYLLSLSDEQLLKFSNILSIAKQNEFTDRKIRVFALSDYDNIILYKDGKEILFKRITPISLTHDYNAFLYEYNVKYPLNIKNRNAFLQELELGNKIR